MMPSLALSEDERLIADAVTQFCARHVAAADLQKTRGEFPWALWKRFCAEEYLALATPSHEAGLRGVIAAVEPLGRACFPGPIVDAFIAAHLLEGREREELCEGELICVVSQPPAFAFGNCAQLFIELEGRSAYRLTPKGNLIECAGLDDEPWARGTFERTSAFAHGARATCVGDVVLASYLAHVAFGLLSKTTEHARTRHQFGKPLGSFQAVAHPLASVHIALTAAARLARAAACVFDEDDFPLAEALAEAALRSSRRAALEAAYECQQKFGAIGITLEGPAHRETSRIRSLATRASTRLAHQDALLRKLGACP